MLIRIQNIYLYKELYIILAANMEKQILNIDHQELLDMCYNYILHS